MLAHARVRSLATLTADAQSLPCRDESFDAGGKGQCRQLRRHSDRRGEEGCELDGSAGERVGSGGEQLLF
jgi:hypothetical protein